MSGNGGLIERTAQSRNAGSSVGSGKLDRAAPFCQAESLTYLRPGIWYAATMTVTLSAPPRRRASSSKVWAASLGFRA